MTETVLLGGETSREPLKWPFGPFEFVRYARGCIFNISGDPNERQGRDPAKA
jgi:hypothetical protein